MLEIITSSLILHASSIANCHIANTLPGETFSYNQTVGERTISNGFKEASIYTSKGVEYGLGGGICQVSSTLYNAVLEANLDAENGVDAYFIREAKKKNMEIIEVESIMFQYNMLDSYSQELQDYLLKSSLKENREDSKKELLELLATWEKGDVEALDRLITAVDEDITDEELKLMEEYNKAMLTDRNIGMANKVEELLKGDKNVFYVVGSAHYLGEDGIIQLLMNKGYTIIKK